MNLQSTYLKIHVCALRGSVSTPELGPIQYHSRLRTFKEWLYCISFEVRASDTFFLSHQAEMSQNPSVNCAKCSV